MSFLTECIFFVVTVERSWNFTCSFLSLVASVWRLGNWLNDRLGGPPNLLLNRYTITGIKRSGHEADFSPTAKVKSKNEWLLGGESGAGTDFSPNVQRRGFPLQNHPTNQYSETNVMPFLFSLLRIKGLYMFRALLAHPQDVLHKQHLVHCVRVMSAGCCRGP
jgi:hypothetical protein